LRLEGTSRGHLVQTPSLLKQDHLGPVVQDRDQMVQGWRLHHLSRKLVPVLGHPHSETMFPDIQKVCDCLCSLPLVLLVGTTEKSLDPSSLHPSFRHLSTLMRCPWTFSPPGWTVPALSAFLHRRDAPVLSSNSWFFTGLSPEEVLQ